MIKEVPYPFFEANQVLSASSLNNLVNYLINEDGLTRNYLGGMGIACGLKASLDSETPAQIRISSGFGFTSLGHLIKIENDCILTHYAEINNIRPSQFIRDCVIDESHPCGYTQDEIDQFREDTPIEGIIELRTMEEGGTILPDFDGQNRAFYQNRCIVLLIFRIEESVGPCLDTCDSGGKKVRFEIKKLMVPRNILNRLFCLCDQEDEAPEACEDPHLFRLRFCMDMEMAASVDTDPGRVNLEPEDEVKANLFGNYRAITGLCPEGEDQFVCDDPLARIQAAYDCAYSTYGGLLNLNFAGNPFTSYFTNIQETIGQIGGEESSVAPNLRHLYLQYVYDYLKDLIAAYEEFMACACQLEGTVICPDRCLFPGFLVLGGLGFDEIERDPCCRTDFIPTCNQTNQPNLIRKSRFLFERMIKLVSSFSLPEDKAIREGDLLDIYVTPSQKPSRLLSERAIPYYYQKDRFEEIRACWNYGLSRKQRFLSIPAYYAITEDNENLRLTRNLDAHDFFRIEGHLGYLISDAFDEIRRLRDCYNLPFDVKCVKLGPPSREVDACPDDFMGDMEVECEDLLAPYLVAREEFLCKLEAEFPDSDLNGVLPDRLKPEPEMDEEQTGIRLFKHRFAQFLRDFLSQVLNGEVPPPVDDIDNEIQNLIMALESRIAVIGEEDPLPIIISNSLICCLKVLWGFIDILNEIIEERTRQLKEEKRFVNFAKQHPGMEHLAGVERGGTFVIVYCDLTDDKGVCQPRVVADFSLPYYCCASGGGTTIVNTFEPSPVIFICKKIFCCPNDPPVPPNPPLPASHEIGLYPAGGDFPTAMDGVGNDIDGAIVEQDGKYFFNPAALSKELFGDNHSLDITISYSYRGQTTSTIVTVWREPMRCFVSGIDEDTNVLTLTSRQPPYEGVYYKWEIFRIVSPGDSSLDIDPVFQLLYLLEGEQEESFIFPIPNEVSGEVRVQLTVTNPGCEVVCKENVDVGEPVSDEPDEEEEPDEEDEFEMEDPEEEPITEAPGTETEEEGEMTTEDLDEADGATEDSAELDVVGEETVEEETDSDTEESTEVESVEVTAEVQVVTDEAEAESNEESPSEEEIEEESPTITEAGEAVSDVEDSSEVLEDVVEDIEATIEESEQEETTVEEVMMEERIDTDAATEEGIGDTSQEEGEPEVTEREVEPDLLVGGELLELETLAKEADLPAADEVGVEKEGTEEILVEKIYWYEERLHGYQAMLEEMAADKNLKRFVCFERGVSLVNNGMELQDFNEMYQKNARLIITTMKRSDKVDGEKMVRLLAITTSCFLDKQIRHYPEEVPEETASIIAKLNPYLREAGLSTDELLRVWNMDQLKNQVPALIDEYIQLLKAD